MGSYKTNKIIQEIKSCNKKMIKNVDRDKIKKMYRNGRTIHQISKELHYPLGVVWYASKKIAENNRKKQLNIYKNYLDTLSDFDLGYVIGIIEGEGCLSIIKDNTRYRIGLSISNRDIKIIEHFVKLMPLNPHKNRIHTYRKYCNNFKRKEWGRIYEYKTNDKKLLFLILNKIYPYMIGKKQEVYLMLKFLKSKDKIKQEQIRKKFAFTKSKKNLKVKLE